MGKGSLSLQNAAGALGKERFYKGGSVKYLHKGFRTRGENKMICMKFYRGLIFNVRETKTERPKQTDKASSIFSFHFSTLPTGPTHTASFSENTLIDTSKNCILPAS